MPSYKLYYFDARGRAETSRLIFAQAGVQYEDCRLTGEEWQKFKPKTPYGVAPVLEVDGKLLGGSAPIGRFLAEEFGLAGSNAIENAELAGIVDFVGDFFAKMVPVLLEKDEAKKAELKKEMIETHIPHFIGTLDKRIGNGSGWVFGSKFTYADLYVTQLFEYAQKVDEKIPEKFPSLAKHAKATNDLPRIAEWIKNRPKTDN